MLGGGAVMVLGKGVMVLEEGCDGVRGGAVMVLGEGVMVLGGGAVMV